ncbi:hypothetical protein DRN69_03605 [Candidatus Pacearchaeota archaeon]|nr:MAG: hypothetical protein DRN69_03605 [Candidatus Pacearchaeota archaeon]
MYCTHLKELLLEEKKIIESCLEEYMQLNKIKDYTEAKMRFIRDFGGSMKTDFCNRCSERNVCDIYLQERQKNHLFKNSFNPSNPCPR